MSPAPADHTAEMPAPAALASALSEARERTLALVAPLADAEDVDRLEAAYDDSAGVTAEFNRNVLHVLNRELDADFPCELFEHVAFFDVEHEWIEMRLRARRACRVRIAALDLDVDFLRGEEVRTEISAKFTRARLEADYAAAGLELAEWITDDEGLFALSLAARA